jgi:hypothetical protein
MNENGYSNGRPQPQRPSSQYGAPPANGQRNGNGNGNGRGNANNNSQTNKTPSRPSESYGVPNAGGRPSQSNVPETIPQQYDSNGGYQY